MYTIKVSAVERCNMKADYGRCHGQQLHWHFDSRTQLCHSFLYSGCGGNANRFDSHMACASVCEEAPRSTMIPLIDPYTERIPPKGFCAEHSTHKDTSDAYLSLKLTKQCAY